MRNSASMSQGDVTWALISPATPLFVENVSGLTKQWSNSALLALCGGNPPLCISSCSQSGSALRLSIHACCMFNSFRLTTKKTPTLNIINPSCKGTVMQKWVHVMTSSWQLMKFVNNPDTCWWLPRSCSYGVRNCMKPNGSLQECQEMKYV